MALDGGQPITRDVATLDLRFGDGSMGTVHYLSNGHRSLPKERLEIFCAGRVLQLDNFRRLRSFGWSDVRADLLWRQDKGHRQCIAAFVDAVSGGKPSPIPFEELSEVTRASFDADDQLAARS